MYSTRQNIFDVLMMKFRCISDVEQKIIGSEN